MAENRLYDRDVAVLQEKMRQMEEHIENNDKRIDAMAKERTSALIWGIMALGTAVAGLIGFIFTMIKVTPK